MHALACGPACLCATPLPSRCHDRPTRLAHRPRVTPVSARDRRRGAIRRAPGDRACAHAAFPVEIVTTDPAARQPTVDITRTSWCAASRPSGRRRVYFPSPSSPDGCATTPAATPCCMHTTCTRWCRWRRRGRVEPARSAPGPDGSLARHRSHTAPAAAPRAVSARRSLDGPACRTPRRQLRGRGRAAPPRLR